MDDNDDSQVFVGGSSLMLTACVWEPGYAVFLLVCLKTNIAS